jgi:hypothetical protein
MTTPEAQADRLTPKQALGNFRRDVLGAAQIPDNIMVLPLTIEYIREGDDYANIAVHPNGTVVINRKKTHKNHGATAYSFGQAGLTACEAYTPTRLCDPDEIAAFVETLRLVEREEDDTLKIGIDLSGQADLKLQ